MADGAFTFDGVLNSPASTRGSRGMRTGGGSVIAPQQQVPQAPQVPGGVIEPSGPASFAPQAGNEQAIRSAVENFLLVDEGLEQDQLQQTAPALFQASPLEQQLEAELQQIPRGTGPDAPPQTQVGKNAPQELLKMLAEDVGVTSDGGRRSLKVKGPLGAITTLEKPEPLRRTRGFLQDVLESGMLRRPNRRIAPLQAEQLRQNINLAFEMAKTLRETDQEEQRLFRELSGKTIEAQATAADAAIRAASDAKGRRKPLFQGPLDEISQTISMASLIGPATQIVNAIDGLRTRDPFANALVNEFNKNVLGKINDIQNQVMRRIRDIEDMDPESGKASIDPKELRVVLSERDDAIKRIRREFNESLVGTLRGIGASRDDINNIKFLALNLYDNLNRRFERVAWSFASAVNGGRITEADIESARALMNPYEMSAGWDEFVTNLANIKSAASEQLSHQIDILPDVYDQFAVEGPLRGLKKAQEKLDVQFDFSDVTSLARDIRQRGGGGK